MNRRTFLRSTACIAGAISVKPAFAAERIPSPCPPTAWTKHGIVLEGTESWEGNDVQCFTNRAESLQGGKWRIWYSASSGPGTSTIAFAEGVPGKEMKKTRAICTPGQPTDDPFSVGNLPEQWRPVQPVHIEMPNGIHRLYFWAHGPQVCRYLVAESTDGRRYRILDPLRPVLFHPHDRAAHGVPSPDSVMLRKQKAEGRPANEPLAESALISNDATNIYQLPDGSFELYTVALLRVPKTDPAYIAEDNAPGLLRVIDRLTSPDGLHFKDRRRVIQRDASDPADQQFYYLAVTHTGKGRVGMLGHYRCAAQTMDLEWCFSRDGISWERPARRAWIPRGTNSAPDCFGIYGPSQLVHRDDRWHLFYTGVNSSHNGRRSHGKPRQVIMWATAENIWS